MPLYEYRCECGQEFEALKRMDDRHNADCPECKKPATLAISNTHFRMAEPFRVIDSQGNITQEKQVVNPLPSLKDTKPVEHNPSVPKPIISRGGNVYYPRKQRSVTNAT